MKSKTDDLDRQPSTSEPLQDASSTAARPTLALLVRLAITMGVRWMSYAFLPLIVFGVALYLGLASWTAAADGGWHGFLEPAFLQAVFRTLGLGVLIASMLLLVWTAIPCAIVATVAWMIQRTLPASIGDTAWGRWLLEATPVPDGKEPSLRRSRLRIWRRLILIPAAVAFALIGTGMVGVEYARRRIETRLNAAIADASRDDPFWRYDRVVEDREDVLDEENSARVVQDVAAMLPEGWFVGGGPYPDDAPAAETDVFVSLDRVSRTGDEVALSDDLVAYLRGEVADAEEAVDEARTLADLDRGRHDLESLLPSDDSDPPDSASARAVACLLSADAAMLAHDGEFATALDACRAMLGTARSIGDEPSLNAQHLRMKIDDWAARAARRVLGQGEPPDDALARFQNLLLDESNQPLAAHGLRGSRAILDEEIRRIRDKAAQPPDYLGGSSFAAFYARDVQAPWARVVLDNQRAVALEWMTELLVICRLDGPSRADRLAMLRARIDEAGAWHGGGLSLASLGRTRRPCRGSTSRLASRKWSGSLGFSRNSGGRPSSSPSSGTGGSTAAGRRRSRFSTRRSWAKRRLIRSRDVLSCWPGARGAS